VSTPSTPVSKPEGASRRLWAGRGSGAPCTVCGEPVEPHEIEYELELVPDADPAGSEPPRPETHRVHVRCLAAWEAGHGHPVATPRNGSLPPGDAPAIADAPGGRSASGRHDLPAVAGEPSFPAREPEAACRRRRP
jgi:hypothetical protein